MSFFPKSHSLLTRACSIILIGNVALPMAHASLREVEAVISEPTGPGSAPALWYRHSPSEDFGVDGAGWAISDASASISRSEDPWGTDQGAFGLAPDATRGLAVPGSQPSTLLASDEGTVILFLKAPETWPPAHGTEEAMIFARGAYGVGPVFDLRISRGLSVALFVSDGGDRPEKLQFGSLSEGQWYLLALRWSKSGDVYEIVANLGELGSGSLQEFRESSPVVGAADAPVTILGRVAGFGTDADRAVTLRGGWITQFAIYESALPDTTLEALFSASNR